MDLLYNCQSDVLLYVFGETNIGGINKGSFSNLADMILNCVQPDSLSMPNIPSPFTSGSSRLEAVSCGFPTILIPPGGQVFSLFKGGPSNDYFVACLEKPSLIDVNLPIYQGGRGYLEILACIQGIMLGKGTLFVGGGSNGIAEACEELLMGEGSGSFFGGDSKDYAEFDICFEISESLTGENFFGGDESRGIAEDCETSISLGEPSGGYFRGGDSADDFVECYIPPCLDLQPAEITSLGTVPVCVGQTITLQASQAASWLWQYSTSPGVWTNYATTDFIVIGSAQEGDFRLIGYGSDPNCVDTSAVFTAHFVTEIPKPVITVEGSSVICIGGSVALTSSPAVSYLWSNGFTTQTIWVTTSGNYTVTITDINGCQATSDITTLTDGLYTAPSAIITPSGKTELCFGNSQLLTSVPAAGYVWSTGETTQSITVNQTGKYTVRITDINGCEATADSVEIVVHDIRPEILYPDGLTVCYGKPITLDLEPDTGNKQWYHNSSPIIGETNSSLHTNIAGFYYATLDTLGCIFDAIAVEVITNGTTTPLANISASHPVLCEGGGVVLVADDAESYQWSTGETSKTILIDTPGKYFLTVEDTFGCYSMDSITIVEVPVTILPEIQVLTGQLKLCNSSSTVTLTVSDGVAWDWNNGETTQNITVPYSDAGIYTVIAYDINGCAVAASEVEVIAVPPIIPIIDAGIATICGTEPVTLFVSPVDASYSYEWSNMATDEYIVVSTAGTYTVTIITTDGCRFTSAPVTITQSPAPTKPIISANSGFSIVNDTILVCPNQVTQVTLTSTLAQNYLWNTDEITQSIGIDSIGNYAVLVVYANGCSAVSDTVTIALKVGMVHIETEDDKTELCPDATIDMNIVGADVGSTFQWYKDDLLMSGEVLSSLTVGVSGSYHAVVSSLSGCIEATNPVIISDFPTTLPIIIPDSSLDICPYDSVRLTVSSYISYLWTWTDGTDSLQLGTTQSIYASEAGEYLLVVTDQFGCVQETSVIVTEKPEYSPSIDATFDSVCQGETITLSVIPTPPLGSTYYWNTGETTPTIDFDNPSFFGNNIQYWVEVLYPEGCTYRSPVKSVDVYMTPKKPEIDVVGTGGICPDLSVSLIATKSDLHTYQWRWETSPGVWENYPGGNSFGIVVDENGYYEVIITDEHGCVNVSDVLELDELSSATVEIYPSGIVSLCQSGGFVILTASQQDPGNTFFWNTGATTQSIMVTQVGFYRVTVTNELGCSVESKRVEVIDPSSLPPANISASGPTTFCEGGSVTLNSTLSPNGLYAWYRWTPTDSTQVGNVQQLIVTEPGHYVMVFTDSNNCRVYSNIIPVTVNPLPDATISPSGTFTVCQGNTITLSATVGTGYTYQWSAPSNATTQTIEATVGTHTVTIFTPYGCSATSMPVIVQESTTQAPMPDADDAKVCFGEKATLVATSTILNPEFTWWDAAVNGTFVGLGSPFETPAIFSEWKVWVSVHSDTECESPRKEVTVTIGANIIFNNVPDSICLDAPPFTVDVTPPAGTLSGNGITASIFDPSVAGIGNHWIYYDVCATEDSVMIIVYLPDFTLNIPSGVCGGDNVDLTSWVTSTNPTIAFSFYEDDQITIIVDPTNVQIPDEGATFYVIAADLEGCMSEMKAIIIPAKKQTGPIFRRPNLY